MKWKNAFDFLSHFLIDSFEQIPFSLPLALGDPIWHLTNLLQKIGRKSWSNSLESLLVVILICQYFTKLRASQFIIFKMKNFYFISAKDDEFGERYQQLYFLWNTSRCITTICFLTNELCLRNAEGGFGSSSNQGRAIKLSPLKSWNNMKEFRLFWLCFSKWRNACIEVLLKINVRHIHQMSSFQWN